jgi:hypothetical protein
VSFNGAIAPESGSPVMHEQRIQPLLNRDNNIRSDFDRHKYPTFVTPPRRTGIKRRESEFDMNFEQRVKMWP